MKGAVGAAVSAGSSVGFFFAEVQERSFDVGGGMRRFSLSEAFFIC